MERKLATIRKIKSVEYILGADNIEKVTIDGWSCITKKGQFKTGDYCVYFEIDSFLPITPEFEFLRKSSYRKMGDKEGFRLRTVRLRGTLSQGLALPMSILPRALLGLEVLEHGSDVTDVLGITKWDPPIPAQLAGKVKGNFPEFICKTDQERIQNIWDDIQPQLRTESFEVTVKLDGSSCTYYLNDGQFGVCSRNLELIEDENNTFWKIARRNKIEELLRAYGRNVALQGEVIGEGIQGNPEKIKGQEFYLFDIWDIDRQAYINPWGRRQIWENFFKTGIKHVPVDWEIGDCANSSIEKMIEDADGSYYDLKEGKIREGIVFKSNMSTLTFKVISNEYLLKEKG